MTSRLPLGLYAIADAGFGDPLALGHALIDEGLQVVQLRCKGWSTADRIAVGRPLAARMHANGGLLIMNDDLQAAVACRAQGVHLGQSDGDPAAARAALPPGAVVGWSTHTIEHIEAVHPTVDYIGFGPLFGTSTKSTPYSPRHSLLSAALHAAGSRPLVGIGGLTPSALPGLRAIGLRHWAAISALYTAPTLRLGVAALR